MRFLRFSYILPRLVLLVLVYLAAEVGSGYVVRWGLAAGGQAAVGAKVEIGSVRSSLLETRLLINDLAVANPNSPMKNLVEANRLEIDFDTGALLRKKLIADYGVISGLAFSTPRETSGALPDAPQTEADAGPSWLAPAASEFAENWLADLEKRFTADVRDQFHSIRLVEEMSERWPAKYRQLETQARRIKADAKRLEAEVRLAKQNPLRYVEFIAQLPQQTTELRRALRDLQTELAGMPGQIKADREAVQAARAHDEQLVREQLQLDAIDAKELTNYLLGEQITGPVGETIAWVRWARRFVPPRNVRPQEPAARGVDVQFAGAQQLPEILVRAMRLEGAARMGGQPVKLVGVVRDWTNQPELHAIPTTVELHTTGGLPLVVQATLDRTHITPRDAFHMDSSGMVLPKLDLGKRGPMRLAVAPSTANITMDVRLMGNQLTGSVVITQQGLAITPQIGSNLLGGRLQTVLAQNVSRIDQAHTEVTLTGTLDAPQMQFSSTLGVALAEAINRAAADVAAAEAERLLARGQQQVDAQLAKFTTEFEKFESKLTSELAAPGEIIASLLGQGGEGAKQIGRSPFGQLFK